MENQQQKISWTDMKWPFKLIIVILVVGGILFAAMHFNLIPGLSSAKSTNISKADMLSDAINVNSTVKLLPVPNVDELEFADVKNRPQIKIMNWVWFGNAGIMAANGGSNTMKGSLMDQYKLNVRMITDNSTDNMKVQQLAFINSFAKGEQNPTTGVAFVTIMGDGATAYIPAMNKQIEKAYGAEYKLKVIGIAGFSYGEDCIVGPGEWLRDPQTMKGALISAVIGDGDWGIGVRFASGDNRININPDPTTYDPNAVNFSPAPDGDFLKAAQEIGRVVKLKEKDATGKLTGKTVSITITGAATWFPGDRQAFQKHDVVKVVSTIQYPNQMGTVIVGCDKWMKQNKDMVVNFLSATLTATNQIKNSDKWFKYATQLAPKVFYASAADASESADDWYKYAKPGGANMENIKGVSVSAGGTLMANLADNLKYFGIKGGNNYYKSVFEYFNGVLKDLNPADFKQNVGNPTPYEEAVDLTYLQSVNIESTSTTKANYADNKGHVVGKRSWNIEFESGKSTVTPEGEVQLKELFNLVNAASENSRLEIVGYTDNVGNPDANIILSLARAKSVKQKLIDLSNHTYSSEKFSTDGQGDSSPVASNETAAGRKQNRRVVITLTQ